MVPGYPEQPLLPAHAVGGVDEIVLRGHGEGGQVLQHISGVVSCKHFLRFE